MPGSRASLTGTQASAGSRVNGAPPSWVTVLKCRSLKVENAVGLVPVGQDDECAVCEPEVETLIACLKANDCCVIVGVKAGDGEATSCEIGQKRLPRCPAEPLAEQIVDLRRRRCGDHKCPRLAG